MSDIFGAESDCECDTCREIRNSIAVKLASEQAEQIKHYLKVIQMLQEHNTGLLMKLKAVQPQKGV